MKKFLFVAAVVAVTGLGLAIHGCSNSSIATQSYTGAGSVWSATLNTDGTFTITRKTSPTSTTANLSVTGTYSRLSSGFVFLTVGSATSPDGTVTGSNLPSAGSTAYGLEVPGMTFLLRPMGGSGEIISMVQSGSCPTANFTANWIKVDPSDANSNPGAAGTDWFGTFSYTASSATQGTATLPAKYDMNASTAGITQNQSLGLATCSNGIMTVSDATMFLTTNGGAMVDTATTNSSNSEKIVGFPVGAERPERHLFGLALRQEQQRHHADLRDHQQRQLLGRCV